MGEETLLIVSLALCFGMVVVAAHTGFSAAFGAFIMGSILAETIEAESIDRLVKPVKDLLELSFRIGRYDGGSCNDCRICRTYYSYYFGCYLGTGYRFGTFGVILSGKPLKTAMQCGFSLTQIGEFAFIIASLGVSLHVTSDFLYPIVVAVSVITTFPDSLYDSFCRAGFYFCGCSSSGIMEKIMMRYSSGSQTALNHENLWKKLILSMVRITVVYSIVSMSIIALSFVLLCHSLKRICLISGHRCWERYL